MKLLQDWEELHFLRVKQTTDRKQSCSSPFCFLQGQLHRDILRRYYQRLE